MEASDTLGWGLCLRAYLLDRGHPIAHLAAHVAHLELSRVLEPSHVLLHTGDTCPIRWI